MSFAYDRACIEAEKQIDKLKEYLDTLTEDSIDKIIDLTIAIKWLLVNELDL